MDWGPWPAGWRTAVTSSFDWRLVSFCILREVQGEDLTRRRVETEGVHCPLVFIIRVWHPWSFASVKIAVEETDGSIGTYEACLLVGRAIPLPRTGRARGRADASVPRAWNALTDRPRRLPLRLFHHTEDPFTL